MSSAESEMSQEPSPAPPPTKDEETSPKPDLKMGKSFISNQIKFIQSQTYIASNMGKHIIMQLQRYMANNMEVHLHFELQSALARWQIPDAGQAYSNNGYITKDE